MTETHPGARPPIELDLDPAAPGGLGAIHERLFELGLTDGLPVVPPTPDLVAAMLAAGPWEPDEVLIDEPTRDITITAHLASVNAVLAGARPEYFPVIGAALQAAGDPAFRLHMPTASTGGATIMVIATGPIVERLGIQCRENLFGPGFRANATIGRTIRLVQLNGLQAVPGRLDRSTQGWPGKFSLCFGEHTEASPLGAPPRAVGPARRPLGRHDLRRRVRPQRLQPRHRGPRGPSGHVRRRDGRPRQLQQRAIGGRLRPRARGEARCIRLVGRGRPAVPLRQRPAGPGHAQADRQDRGRPGPLTRLGRPLGPGR